MERLDLYARPKQVAALLACTQVHVAAMARTGEGPPRDAQGRYPLKELGEWMRTRFGRGADKSRLVKTQADKAEMELARLRGELAPIDEMAADYAEHIYKCKKRLLLISNAVATQIVPASQVPETKALIEKYIHEALAELSSDS